LHVEPKGAIFADGTLHDARYALRALRRQPLFTLTAVLTLALTIAAVATLFTITNTILWRPLPADHPERLVTVLATRPEGRILAPVSYPDYLRLRDGMRTVSALAAHYSTAPLFVTIGGRAEEVLSLVVREGMTVVLAGTVVGIHEAVGQLSYTSGMIRSIRLDLSLHLS
jgi:hypothetical protein